MNRHDNNDSDKNIVDSNNDTSGSSSKKGDTTTGTVNDGNKRQELRRGMLRVWATSTATTDTTVGIAVA